jgi:hypothetical protein
MPKIVNRAYMTTATTGNGTITLGSAVGSFRSFAASGVVDGDVVRYVIEDGDNWEIGSGTYAASGTTLTRAVEDSSSGGTAINLSGTAVVFVTGVTADFNIVRDSDPAVDTNPPNVGAVWVNSTSGSMFVCTDNTVGENVWFGVHSNASEVFPMVDVEYLLVAGGGGGSDSGGGGAGGLLSSTTSLAFGETYSVVIGAGGSGGLNNTDDTATNGESTTFASITATGGGHGGSGYPSAVSGGTGGSGGGASMTSLAGSGTAGQGNDGGGVVGGDYVGGGGGGAGAVGGTGSGTTGIGGAGGAGLASSITGASVFYAGGGGGGPQVPQRSPLTAETSQSTSSLALGVLHSNGTLRRNRTRQHGASRDRREQQRTA